MTARAVARGERSIAEVLQVGMRVGGTRERKTTSFHEQAIYPCRRLRFPHRNPLPQVGEEAKAGSALLY
jgi:hypothetical protein